MFAFNVEQEIDGMNELRDLRFDIGKYEDAIEEALEEYDISGSADKMVAILRRAYVRA